jgi:hypothetical protein
VKRNLTKEKALLPPQKFICMFYLFSYRPVGSDIAQGQLVLPRGRVLAPSDLGLLATVGVTSVPVHR